MNKTLVKDLFGWGFALWLFGYILGIVFFAFIPAPYLGWSIMPFGLAFTLWVLFKKIKYSELKYYVKLGMVWALMAVILDYLLLVKVFKPADGYYKLDVYIYYILTLLIPIGFGWWKNRKQIA